MSLFRIDLHPKSATIGSWAGALSLDFVIAKQLCPNITVRPIHTSCWNTISSCSWQRWFSQAAAQATFISGFDSDRAIILKTDSGRGTALTPLASRIVFIEYAATTHRSCRPAHTALADTQACLHRLGESLAGSHIFGDTPKKRPPSTMTQRTTRPNE